MKRLHRGAELIRRYARRGGVVSDRQHRTIEQHLGTCGACRHRLAETMAAGDPDLDDLIDKIGL